MDALEGFEHKHNNQITLNSSIGKIELTYRTHDGEAQEWKEGMGSLFETLEDLPYEEPARNQPSHFQAVLVSEDNKIRFMARETTASEAIKSLYKQEAVSRFEAEFYPQGAEINY
jgi:hypothetical protein